MLEAVGGAQIETSIEELGAYGRASATDNAV